VGRGREGRRHAGGLPRAGVAGGVGDRADRVVGGQRHHRHVEDERVEPRQRPQPVRGVV